MIIKRTIEINCSQKELWAWLTEFEKLKVWNKSMIKEELISTGDVGPGFKSKVLISERGEQKWYENEIIKYIPRHTISIVLRGGSLGKHPMKVDYSIKEIGEKCTMRYESHWKPSGLILRIFLPVIKRAANKNLDQCLAKLKEHLEGYE